VKPCFGHEPRLEGADLGVKVSCACPGFVRTNSFQNAVAVNMPAAAGLSDRAAAVAAGTPATLAKMREMRKRRAGATVSSRPGALGSDEVPARDACVIARERPVPGGILREETCR
jgi:hypothetical protein